MDTSKVVGVYKDKAIPDTEGLLDMVMKPETVTARYHVKLLDVLAEQGWKDADENFAVGPVLENWQRVPEKMRVVHYSTRA